jgi:hypothetical protein
MSVQPRLGNQNCYLFFVYHNAASLIPIIK